MNVTLDQSKKLYKSQPALKKQKAAEAADKITDIAKKRNIDPETIRMIREQVYGIVK